MIEPTKTFDIRKFSYNRVTRTLVSKVLNLGMIFEERPNDWPSVLIIQGMQKTVTFYYCLSQINKGYVVYQNSNNLPCKYVVICRSSVQSLEMLAALQNGF